MVWPFAKNRSQLERKLKPASYEIDFLGTVHLSDEDGKAVEREILQDTPFTLRKNSIAYVYIATTFRLPHYLALRFNLKITHVHKGLLLGTGPLVDPGFCGRLLIPLHNITAKDFTIIGGEGLIWVEFTKLSSHQNWDERARLLPASYIPFREDKWNLTVQQYLNMATDDGKPSISSIPGEIAQANKSAKKAEDFSKKILWGGTFALSVSLGSVLVGTWNLICTTNKNINDFRKEANAIYSAQQDLINKIKILEAELRKTKNDNHIKKHAPVKQK
jgi:deoxycytidine triphosphate deaminase